MESLQWYGDEIIRKVNRRRSKVVRRAAVRLLAKANETVPERDGGLMRSGKVSVNEVTGTAAVTYDEPYSARQHEDLSAHHVRGRAKWLQRTQDEQERSLVGGMAADIAEELS